MDNSSNAVITNNMAYKVAIIVTLFFITLGAGFLTFLYYVPSNLDHGRIEPVFTSASEALRAGDYDQALSIIKMEAQKNNTSPEIQAQLANALVMYAGTLPSSDSEQIYNLYDESIAHFEKALELGFDQLFPAYDIFLFNYLKAVLGVEQYEKAERIYRRLVENHDSALDAKVLMGSAYFEYLNNSDEATIIFEKILSDTNSTQNNVDIAKFYMMRLSSLNENFEDTKKFASDIINSQHLNRYFQALVHLHLAFYYSKNSSFSVAEEQIMLAEQIVNEPGRFVCNLADAHYSSEDYQKALENALKRESSMCWIVAGLTLSRLGRADEAEVYFKKADARLLGKEINSVVNSRARENTSDLLDGTSEDW